MSYRTVLITGITGQVGSPLADYILENTVYDVVGMMRWQEPLDNLYHLTERINHQDRIKLHYADLNDAGSVRQMIEKHKPVYISHLAAQSYPKTSFDIPVETLQTNIIGTANLLEAVRHNVEFNDPLNEYPYDPIVHICSSSEVYGKAKTGVELTEDTPFHASSPYSISKIGTDYLGRFYGEAYGIKTFVTRMGTHSGPRRSDVFFESTVAKQIALIEAGFQTPYIRTGNLEGTRTFQDCRDAVRAYWLLLEASADGRVEPGEYFNIAGEEAFKLTEIIDMFLEMTDVEMRTVEDIDRFRPIDADYQMFDNTKIRETIDWKPEISVKQMLEDLLNHWRDEIGKGKIPLNR